MVYGGGDVNLTIREPSAADLDRCLALLASPYLCDQALHPQLRAMWFAILASGCGIGFAVSDGDDDGRLVHFGFIVFVRDEAATEYHACRKPLIAQRILAAWIAGERPFLDLDQIARGNAGAGVNLVVTHYGGLHGDGRATIANYESFRWAVRGWNIRTYTNEVFPHPERPGREFGATAGYRILEYADGALREAGIPADDRRPFLWVATRADAASSDGYAVKILFDTYAPPRCGFTSLEQALLRCALDGDTDASLATRLGFSESAVKKHFRKIHDKATDARVVIASRVHASCRGAETRRHLLNYLRDHPEELRPYSRVARTVDTFGARLKAASQ